MFLLIKAGSLNEAAKIITRLLNPDENDRGFKKYVQKRFLRILEEYENGGFRIEGGEGEVFPCSWVDLVVFASEGEGSRGSGGR